MLQDASARAADRHRLPPQHAAQPGGRHRRRGAALRDARRPRGHHRHGVARQHDRLRAVPQPQVRPRSRRRTTTGCWPSSTTASTASTARARRSSTAGSWSPSSSSRRPRMARRRDALRREAEALRLEIETRDLDAEIAAFEREIAGPGARVHAARAGALRGEERGHGARRSRTARCASPGSRRTRTATRSTVRATLAGITAFRLEALPDASLPQHGPGRSSSGAFVVTSLSLRAGEPPGAARARGRGRQREEPRGRAAARQPRRDRLGRHGRDGGRAPALRGRGAAAAASRRHGAQPAHRHARVPVGLRRQASLGRFRLSATTAPASVRRPAGAGGRAPAARHASRRAHARSRRRRCAPGSVRSPPRSTPRATAPARSRSSSTR